MTEPDRLGDASQASPSHSPGITNNTTIMSQEHRELGEVCIGQAFYTDKDGKPKTRPMKLGKIIESPKGLWIAWNPIMLPEAVIREYRMAQREYNQAAIKLGLMQQTAAAMGLTSGDIRLSIMTKQGKVAQAPGAPTKHDQVVGQPTGMDSPDSIYDDEIQPF